MLIRGCEPCATPLNTDTATREIFATTPYDATPMLPTSFNITILKATVITPDENSPTKAETPSFAQLKSFIIDGTHGLKQIVFFFEAKWKQQIAQPTTGESAVASAAPCIPIFSGNISTQSITILNRLLNTVAVIAIDGEPSFLTKALHT